MFPHNQNVSNVLPMFSLGYICCTFHLMVFIIENPILDIVKKVIFSVILFDLPYCKMKMETECTTVEYCWKMT